VEKKLLLPDYMGSTRTLGCVLGSACLPFWPLFIVV